MKMTVTGADVDTLAIRGDAVAKAPKAAAAMNVLFWVLQAALAFVYFAGGAYKLFRSDQLATDVLGLPPVAWGVLGGFEMLGAVLLVLPIGVKWMRVQTPLAGAALAIESLILAGLYAQLSLAWTATNPMPWALVLGLLAAFVSYGRYAIRRQA